MCSFLGSCSEDQDQGCIRIATWYTYENKVISHGEMTEYAILKQGTIVSDYKDALAIMASDSVVLIKNINYTGQQVECDIPVGTYTILTIPDSKTETAEKFNCKSVKVIEGDTSVSLSYFEFIP